MFIFCVFAFSSLFGRGNLIGGLFALGILGWRKYATPRVAFALAASASSGAAAGATTSASLGSASRLTWRLVRGVLGGGREGGGGRW